MNRNLVLRLWYTKISIKSGKFFNWQIDNAFEKNYLHIVSIEKSFAIIAAEKWDNSTDTEVVDYRRLARRSGGC